MKKQMLSEAEIKKMMRFANIHPLSEKFLKENEEAEKAEDAKQEEEEELSEDNTDANDTSIEEGGMPYKRDDDEKKDENIGEEMGEEEAPLDAEDPMPEMEPEAGAEGGTEDMVNRLVAGFAELIADVTGVPVSSETTDEEPSDEIPMDDEGPMGDEDPAGRDVYEETSTELEETDTELEETTTEDIVNEVTRRVAKRLVELNNKK